MTIIVCPLSKVTSTIAVRAPERIVSLLDPGCAFPETGPAYHDRHLCLSLHDAHAPAEGQEVPTRKHVDVLLAFLARWRDRETWDRKMGIVRDYFSVLQISVEKQGQK